MAFGFCSWGGGGGSECCTWRCHSPPRSVGDLSVCSHSYWVVVLLWGWKVSSLDEAFRLSVLTHPLFQTVPGLHADQGPPRYRINAGCLCQDEGMEPRGQSQLWWVTWGRTGDAGVAAVPHTLQTGQRGEPLSLPS